MKNLPVQQSAELMKLSVPRSIHHINSQRPPSQINAHNYQLCSTHHIASGVKVENMKDDVIDNINGNITSAQNIRHQRNISNGVNTVRSVPTFNSQMHGPNIHYQSKSHNLINVNSSNLPGNNINAESNIHQQHTRNTLEGTMSSRGDVGFYQFPVQYGSDGISSTQQRYPGLKGYLRDPQDESQSTFTFDENSVSADSSKDCNYDDTSSSE